MSRRPSGLLSSRAGASTGRTWSHGLTKRPPYPWPRAPSSERRLTGLTGLGRTDGPRYSLTVLGTARLGRPDRS